MKEILKREEKVLIFYHPLDRDPKLFNYEIFIKGKVLEAKKFKDGYIHYKVIDDDGKIYSGLHGMVSSTNYFFITKEEYIDLLKEKLKEIEEKKEKFSRMISLLESDKIDEKRKKKIKKKNGI